MGLLSRGLVLSLLFFSVQAYAQQNVKIVKDSLKVKTIVTNKTVNKDQVASIVFSQDSTDINGYAELKTVVNDITDTIDTSFINSIDDLRNKWYIENIDSVDYIDAATVQKIKHDRISFTGDIIVQQMDSLNSAIQLTYNNIVRSYIDLYTLRRREQVCSMMGLAEYYFPMFEEELDRQGLPLELKYLPVIESALNPIAFSRAGASGLWQFMYGTGKQYKLNIDSYIDERRDPKKSTVAAVTYLKDLYNIYGDWMLVIAAYNCGPGNVNKAIRRSGGVKNYWDVYFHLPKETRGYVPTFIAAMYVFNYSEDYNLYPLKSDFPPLCDTVMIRKKLHFEQIAQVVNMPLEQIIELNPQYKNNIIPATAYNPLAIKMPYNYASEFVEKHDSVLAYNRLKYFDNKDRIVDPRARYQDFVQTSPNVPKKVYYTVKRGDVLGSIANKYKVRVSDLKYWNKIKKNTVRRGQKLVVYLPSKGNNEAIAEVSVKSESSSKASKSNYTYHKVKRGENLWTIARKYPGVSNKDIILWNNITNAKVVKAGTRLKIML